MMEFTASDSPQFLQVVSPPRTDDMVEETVGAQRFEALCRDAQSFLCRDQSVIPDDVDSMLLSPSELERQILSNREPIVTIKSRIPDDKINEYLKRLSDAEKNMWKQECDDIILGKQRASTPQSTASLARQANSAGGDDFGDDCGWDFGGAAVGVTAGRLYDDSPSSRQLVDTSPLPPPPAVAFAPNADASQQADRALAYEVYFRCKATEALQQEELEKIISQRIIERACAAIHEQSRGKKANLQTLLDHLRHETERSRGIVSKIPGLSASMVSDSFRDNPNQMIMSRNLTQCEQCSTVFTMVTRRHHCRRCGRCLCNACSCCLGKLPVDTKKENNRVGEAERLCTVCYDVCLAAQETGFAENEAQFHREDKAVLGDGLPRFYAIPPQDYAAALSPAHAQILAHKATEGVVAIAATGADYCVSVFKQVVQYAQQHFVQTPLIADRGAPQ